MPLSEVMFFWSFWGGNPFFWSTFFVQISPQNFRFLGFEFYSTYFDSRPQLDIKFNPIKLARFARSLRRCWVAGPRRDIVVAWSLICTVRSAQLKPHTKTQILCPHLPKKWAYPPTKLKFYAPILPKNELTPHQNSNFLPPTPQKIKNFDSHPQLFPPNSLRSISGFAAVLFMVLHV